MTGRVLEGTVLDPGATRRARCTCGATTVRDLDSLERWAREHQAADPELEHVAYAEDPPGESYIG